MKKIKKETKDIYQEITDKIISDLETGTPVWEKCWEKGFGGFPENISSKTFYSGINTLILWLSQDKRQFETSQWLSFKQAKELGGSVKKKEKSTPVVFFKMLEVTDKKTDEERKIPMIRTFPVFNIAQCEGLEHLVKKVTLSESIRFEEVEKAESLIKATEANISHLPIDRACYIREEDKILMPKKSQFKDQEGYYSTAFHELSHWTGHELRLDRKKNNKKGSTDYAFEELIAEISASFICCHLDFKYSTQHSAYIENWLKVLKNDKKAIFKASALAQKATKFILTEAS